MYNAATGEPELIGKGSGMYYIIWDACKLPHSELCPSFLMSCKHTQAGFWQRQLMSYPDIRQRSVHDPLDSSQSHQAVQVVCYQSVRQWHPMRKLHLSASLHSAWTPACAKRGDCQRWFHGQDLCMCRSSPLHSSLDECCVVSKKATDFMLLMGNLQLKGDIGRCPNRPSFYRDKTVDSQAPA